MIVGHKIRALKRHLKQGGVVAYATRAVFGLGVDPDSARGLQRLLRLKRRPKQKGLIVIAHEAKQLGRFHAPLTAEENRLMTSRWPGNHTWLVPAHAHLNAAVTGNRRPRLVALRVDDYPPTYELTRSLGMALISTSANRAGQRPAKSYRELLRWLGPAAGKIGQQGVPETRQSSGRQDAQNLHLNGSRMSDHRMNKLWVLSGRTRHGETPSRIERLSGGLVRR